MFSVWGVLCCLFVSVWISVGGVKNSVILWVFVVLSNVFGFVVLGNISVLLVLRIGSMYVDVLCVIGVVMR